MVPFLRKNLLCFFTNNAAASCSLSVRHFSSCSEDGAILHLLQHKYEFSPQVAARVASALNRVDDAERSDSVLSFLKERGFSNAQLERIAKHRPQVLLVIPEDTIKPKIMGFQDWGFCSDDIADFISRNPTILHTDVNSRIIPSLSILKGILGTNDAVAKFWCRAGGFSHTDLEKSMVPNIDFLKRCAIPMERILKLVCQFPRCLLFKPESFRKFVETAEKMGANRKSGVFIHALRVVSQLSDKNLELKLQASRNCGFTESDIVNIFSKAPSVFAMSTNKLKRVKDTILATGKYDLSCIVNNPASLTCSTEKRYKPRFRVLEILESKNLIKSWPSLSKLYPMTDDKFFEQYVGPYLCEVGEVWSTRQ